MESSVKRKLRIVLIAFAIILIPLGYLVKNLIANHYHDKAMQYLYNEPHIGMKISEVNEKAISYLDKAIKLNKRNILFYKNKSEVLWELDETESALKVLKEAETNVSKIDNAMFYFRMSQLYYQLNDYESALKSVHQAVVINENPDMLVFQGVLHEYLDDRDAAINVYSNALEKYNQILREPSDNLHNLKRIEYQANAAILDYIVNHDKSKALTLVDSLISNAPSGVDMFELLSMKGFIFYCPVEKLGMKKLLYDEKVKLYTDSFKEAPTIWQILDDNLIYCVHDGEWDTIDLSRYILEVKEVYKTKAIELGFKEFQ